jgi:hypothetical protein
VIVAAGVIAISAGGPIAAAIAGGAAAGALLVWLLVTSRAPATSPSR